MQFRAMLRDHRKLLRFVLFGSLCVAAAESSAVAENLFQPFASPVAYDAGQVVSTSVFTVKGYPGDIDQFQKIQRDIARSPAGGAAMFVLALLLRVENPEEPALASDALTATLSPSLLTGDPNGLYGFTAALGIRRVLDDALRARPFLPRAYVAGTSPADFYALPAKIQIAVDETSESMLSSVHAVVYVRSSGTREPREVEVVKGDDGLWRVYSEMLFEDVADPGSNAAAGLRADLAAKQNSGSASGNAPGNPTGITTGNASTAAPSGSRSSPNGGPQSSAPDGAPGPGGG